LQPDQEHFDYLARRSGEIITAGGLGPDEAAWFACSLWVFEVSSRERAKELGEDNSYFKLGLRKNYRLFRWGNTPCDGEVIL
jgi:uncharacterized protein YciI